MLEEELMQVNKRLQALPQEERRLVEGCHKGFYADFMMREEVERLRAEKSPQPFRITTRRVPPGDITGSPELAKRPTRRPGRTQLALYGKRN